MNIYTKSNAIYIYIPINYSIQIQLTTNRTHIAQPMTLNRKLIIVTAKPILINIKRVHKENNKDDHIRITKPNFQLYSRPNGHLYFAFCFALRLIVEQIIVSVAAGVIEGEALVCIWAIGPHGLQGTASTLDAKLLATDCCKFRLKHHFQHNTARPFCTSGQ